MTELLDKVPFINNKVNSELSLPLSLKPSDLSLDAMKAKGGSGKVSTGGGMNLMNKFQAAGNVLKMFSAAGKALDIIPNALGMNTDIVNQASANRAGFGKAQKATQWLQKIPGAQFMTMFANKKMEDAKQSTYLNTVGSGYTASMQDIQAAQDIGGKNILFGKEKAQSFLSNANAQNAAIARIGMETELAKQNDVAALYQQQNFNKYSGFAPKLLVKKGIRFPELNEAERVFKTLKTKQGKVKIDLGSLLIDMDNLFNPIDGTDIGSTTSKIISSAQDGLNKQEVEDLVKNQIFDKIGDSQSRLLKVSEGIVDNTKEIQDLLIKKGKSELIPLLQDPYNINNIKMLRDALSSSTESLIEGVNKFQLGGKITSNYIPEGALHRNKHHIDEVNPDLKGQITEKGIPVVSLSEGGALQHAEIEGNELTLSLPTTQKIEEYYHNYQTNPDDTILIECGKYFVNEIMKNTEDPGKLIKDL